MKWNLKPWQIGLICAAGVVVIGGAGTGIWYGVTHAGNTAEEDTNPSVIESVQDAEPALDEPTATATETESETETEPETTAPKPTEKEISSESAAPSTEETITWELDTALSEEVSRLMSERFPNAIWDPSITTPAGPGNAIKDNRVMTANNLGGFTGKTGSNSAEEIVAAWTACYLHDGIPFNILVYRYHGPGEGYVFTAVRHAS